MLYLFNAVELPRLVGVEREVELVNPAELEASLAECIVPLACHRVMLCKVSSMGGNLVGDNAFAYILLVRQRKMFLRRNIAKHCSAEPSDNCSANGRCYMVVSRCHIGS